MSNGHGYIKLHRAILENPISKKADYAWLWITMLLKATHKKREMLWNDQIIELNPGQFITGRKKLSSETGISQSKVYRILKYLENEQQIEQQKTNKFTLITISNWDKYQSVEQQLEQQLNNKRTTTEQQLNTNKNVKKEKNVKNDKKNTPYQELVELFNSTCTTLPKVINLTSTRKNNLRIRWKKYGTIEIYQQVFNKAEESDFLSGRNGVWANCNFDWIIKEANMIKILEGNYDNDRKNPVDWDKVLED